MRESKRPIAVIDSGIGGISVLVHLVKELPGEDFVYFGDTVNAPYGSKTTDEICDVTVRNIQMLMSEYSVKAVVIACNTATGAAAERCRHRSGHPYYFRPSRRDGGNDGGNDPGSSGCRHGWREIPPAPCAS